MNAGAFAALLVFGGAPTFADVLPSDLARALRHFDCAHYQSDIAALERLTSPDYMVLNSSISLENKQQFLADFNLPGFKIDPYKRQEQKNEVWADAAVTAGTVMLVWTQDGRHQSRRLRYVDVWRKQNGRWQVTFTQVTRVASKSTRRL